MGRSRRVVAWGPRPSGNRVFLLLLWILSALPVTALPAAVCMSRVHLVCDPFVQGMVMHLRGGGDDEAGDDHGSRDPGQHAVQRQQAAAAAHAGGGGGGGGGGIRRRRRRRGQGGEGEEGETVAEGGQPPHQSAGFGTCQEDAHISAEDEYRGAAVRGEGDAGAEAAAAIRDDKGRGTEDGGRPGAKSPAEMAAAALQSRLKSPMKAEWRWVGNNERAGSERQADEEVYRTRIKRVHKFRIKEPREARPTKTRITKGIPKAEWEKLLHKKRCVHVSERGAACKLEPNFGDPSDGRAIFCKTHKAPRHVDVRLRMCEIFNCNKHRVFGSREEGVPRYCAEHKGPHMVDLINRRCKLPDGCEKQASFGDAETRIALYCMQHKLQGHVNVRKKSCSHTGCASHSSFGEVGMPAMWCSLHKKDGMVNRVSKLCKYPHGCMRSPSFGSAQDGVFAFCSLHRGPNDVNLRLSRMSKHKVTCKREGCRVKPIFGDPGTRIAQFCRGHSPPGFIDLANRLCTGQNCTRRALFAPLPPPRPGEEDKSQDEGGTLAPRVGWGQKIRPIYCSRHRGEGDVDVVNRRCQAPRCSTHPSYGIQGQGRPLFCGRHKMPDHVYIFGGGVRKKAAHGEMDKENCSPSPGREAPGWGRGSKGGEMGHMAEEDYR